MVALVRSFPFTPTCPGQYIHGSFRGWMKNIDTFQFGLPIPRLFVVVGVGLLLVVVLASSLNI